MPKSIGRGRGRPKKNENELPVKPPKFLKGEAYNLYRRIRPLLVENKIATDLDRSLLESFCIQYQIIRESYQIVSEYGPVKAVKTVQVFGDGDDIKKTITTVDMEKSPALKAMNDATKELRSMADQLGLSPKSREEILKNVKQDNTSDDEPKSNIFELLTGSGNNG